MDRSRNLASAPSSPVRTRRRSLAASATVVVMAALLSACGGGGDDDAKDSTSTTAGSSDGGKSTETTKVGAPLGVVATRDGADGKIPLRLEVNSLKRSNGLAVLTFTVRNLATIPAGASANTDRWQVASFFDDGNYKNGARTESAVDGIYLIDSANKKRYMVVRDSAGECVCSSDMGRVFANAQNETGPMSATFGAPPNDVKKIDLYVPGFGTFNDVPVS